MRFWLCCSGALLTAASAADHYPSRPIRLLIPFPPAGITDLSGRIVAEASARQAQAAGHRREQAGRQRRDRLEGTAQGRCRWLHADGRQSRLAGASTTRWIPRRVRSDEGRGADRRDRPNTPTAMVVNKKMPVNSVKEFIAYAKERPGKLTFGSTGVGAMDYLAGELFMQKTGISMVHVPYSGGPLALNDLIGGPDRHHHRGLSGGDGAGPLAARSKASPSAARTRCRRCPDLPTFEEAGVPGVVLTGWLGIYGPPKMPEDVRAKLGAAIVEVVNQPEIAEEVPRHRLRAHDRSGRQGVHRPPRSRGQALGGVSDRARPAEIVSMAPSLAAPDRFAARRRQGVRHRTRGARRARSRRARRRIPVAAGPVRLRQIDGAPHHRRPERATRGTVDLAGRRRCPPRHRLRVPGADLDALDDGVRQRLPAAEADRHRQGRGRAPHHGHADAGRPCRLRARPIRANCPAACGCGCRSRARSSPRRASC